MEEPSTRDEIPIRARPPKERRAALTSKPTVDAAIYVARVLGARTMSRYSHIGSKTAV